MNRPMKLSWIHLKVDIVDIIATHHNKLVCIHHLHLHLSHGPRNRLGAATGDYLTIILHLSQRRINILNYARIK